MKRAELIEIVVQTPSIQHFVRKDQGALWTLIKCVKKFFNGLKRSMSFKIRDQVYFVSGVD